MTGGPDAWILALDVGSSSVRGRLFRPDGRALDPGPAARVVYAWRRPRPGAMECDARELVARVERVVDGCLERARQDRLEIAAVGIATFWHGVFGLDSAGEPLFPILGWGDTRPRSAVAELRERLVEPEVHARTGCYLESTYPLAKIAWLRRRDPEIYARVRAWISIGEYLEWLFFGVRRCSLSIASGTGLLDLHRLEWDAPILAELGLSPASLVELVDRQEPVSGLRREYAARWPELAAVPWYPAVGDGACANVGSGAVGTRRPGLSVGTSAAVRVIWEADAGDPVPDGLWCYLVDRRRRVAGGALSNGGNAIAWLHENWRLPEPAALDRHLRHAPPDGHGLTVLPSLVEERAVAWASEGVAAVIGTRFETKPAEVAQAWMEAIAHRLALYYEQLEARFGRAEWVAASGGALQIFPSWARTFADVLDRPVRLSADPEATSRGAALLAADSVGWIPDLESVEPPGCLEFGSNPARHRTHRDARERSRALARALEPWLGQAGGPAEPPSR